MQRSLSLLLVSQRTIGTAAAAAARSVLRQLHSHRVAPQSLQVIKLSGLAVENVDYEIAVIHQHPLASVVAFHARGARPLLLQLLDNRVGYGLHLSRVRAGGDDGAASLLG